MLSQANSSSISSTLFQLSITSSPSFFLRQFCTTFNRTRQISRLLHLNDFKTKSKLKWIFQSKERHKTVNRSWHHWNNLNLTDSSILLTLEIGFLTSKSCNTLWKKINVWAYITYFFVVPTCTDFFVFRLIFSIWKSIWIYMLFMWSFIFKAP